MEHKINNHQQQRQQQQQRSSSGWLMEALCLQTRLKDLTIIVVSVSFHETRLALSMISVEVKCIFLHFKSPPTSLHHHAATKCWVLWKCNNRLLSSLLHTDIENMWRWWRTLQSGGQIFLTIHNWNILRLFFEIFFHPKYFDLRNLLGRRET